MTLDSSMLSPATRQASVVVPPVVPISAALMARGEMASYLEQIDEVAHAEGNTRTKADGAYQQRLVQMRLGLASSLFIALRAKDASTAGHSLRVALGCSSWSLRLNLTEQQRDELEVAALLHDIGKMGVPDHVLFKPGKLDASELLAMERSRMYARDILGGLCSSGAILENIHYAPAWFDGRKHGFDRKGEQLPLGARIISIVDAFDSMTTDHVYRRALSRERAVAELFACRGSQFDPHLVEDFATLLQQDQVTLTTSVARRWLQQLQPETANAWWRLGTPAAATAPQEPDAATLFHDRLVDNMHDGVVFVDNGLKIVRWNRAAERLTGISAAGVLHKHWLPSLLEMRDEHGTEIPNEECPLAFAVVTGVQTLRRLSIAGRNGVALSVDAHMVPVMARGGTAHGAALLLRDASRQITLEERVETLHEQATRDALTQVANRAEFDRTLVQFVQTHLEAGLPCSLIICDIDHFKKVNDTFGHQVGDEALIAFAALLKACCRPGDLVARYGGEEFAMLCADCDNATATGRAEEVRRTLAATAQPALHGKVMTASFGVTEVQGGDSAETMLRRADRALYQAKDNGRNLVVQLGSGMSPEPVKAKTGWLAWFVGGPPEQVLERDLLTPVPMNVVAEKLRGFVADQHAEIVSVEQNHVVLRLDAQNTPLIRRRNDRPVPFFIELRFEERRVDSEGRGGANLHTFVHVTIRPKRQRDRRRQDVHERARHLLVSLKSYLMAHELTESREPETRQEETVFKTLKSTLAPWLGKGNG